MLLVHLQKGGILRRVKRPNAPSSDIQTNKQTNKTRQQLLVHIQGGDEGRRVKRQNATPDKQRIKQTRQGVNARTQRCQVDLMKTNKQSFCTWCIVHGKEWERGKNTPTWFRHSCSFQQMFSPIAKVQKWLRWQNQSSDLFRAAVEVLLWVILIVKQQQQQQQQQVLT